MRRLLTGAILALVLYATAAAAEDLWFRKDPATGDVIAVISGLRPLCSATVRPPLATSIDGASITITSNALDSGGGCWNPDYVGPYYEVTADLGRLTAALYSVTWLWQGYSYSQFHRTVMLAPASLDPQPVPAISPAGPALLGVMLALLAWRRRELRIPASHPRRLERP